MKASDSVTSLSQLNVCDTGCHFCSDTDIENSGVQLHDSKQFVSCNCRFAFHIPCWNTYIDSVAKEEGVRIPCPICKTDILPYKVIRQWDDPPKTAGNRSPFCLFNVLALGIIILGVICAIILAVTH